MTQLAIVKSEQVKPAHDYHNPAWEFPDDGKIIALGFDRTEVIESTFGQRVHFWQSGSISRKSDIPDNISAIFVHPSIRKNDGENRRISDCARSRGVPIYTCVNNNLLSTELTKVLRGARLAFDPDLPPSPVSPTANPPPTTPSAPTHDVGAAKPKGWVKAFFAKNLDLQATDPRLEVERVLLLIKAEGYKMSMTAAMQHYYIARGKGIPRKKGTVRANPAVEPVEKLIEPQVKSGALIGLSERIGMELDTNLRAVKGRMAELAALATKLDQENTRLSSALRRALEENTSQRATIQSLREDASTLKTLQESLRRLTK